MTTLGENNPYAADSVEYQLFERLKGAEAQMATCADNCDRYLGFTAAARADAQRYRAAVSKLEPDVDLDGRNPFGPGTVAYDLFDTMRSIERQVSAFAADAAREDVRGAAAREKARLYREALAKLDPKRGAGEGNAA